MVLWDGFWVVGVLEVIFCGCVMVLGDIEEDWVGVFCVEVWVL